MEWYWWVLIIVALVGMGYLKLKVWGNIQKKKQAKKDQIDKIKEEE